MEVRPGYKQTEIGVIPEDWSVKSLGTLGDALIGLTYAPSDVRRYGTIVLRSSNIQNDALAFEDNVFVDMEIPQRIMVRPGDVLICVRNGSRPLIGKTALLDERTNGMTFGAFMAVFRSDHGQYINYMFRSNMLKRQINEHLGATINQITNKSLNSFEIPVPPTDGEVEAIGTALSDVDALLDAIERLIAKKRDLKQATMQQLLTGKTRLPGFEGNWELVYIEEVANITTGSKNTQDRVEDGKYPFFVRSETVERINTYSFDGEAVLTAGDGVGTGKVYHYINGKFDIHQRVYRISNFCESVNGYFFYLYFSRNFYQRIIKMTAKSSVDSVRLDMIARMQIPLPNLEEQNAIAKILSDMNSEIIALEKRRTKTADLKKAMMQELLTGKTRLVKSGANHA